MSLIKSQLIQNITDQNPHLYIKDVERIINTIFSEITELKKREEELNKTISDLDLAREKANTCCLFPTISPAISKHGILDKLSTSLL